LTHSFAAADTTMPTQTNKLIINHDHHNIMITGTMEAGK
jgi:hypothetical protein